MTRCWRVAMVIMVALVGAGLAFAQLPPLIPRDILFGDPECVDPKISPEGNPLAARARDGHHVLQVWVRTGGQAGDTQLTADKKRGIRFYGWTDDGEHRAYGQEADGDENWQLYAVNLTSGIGRDLPPFQGIQARFGATTGHERSARRAGRTQPDRGHAAPGQ